ncbi:MAG: GNAT family N-acetyltransferase [Proteobacteria bacterium]|nr:GNAT family N-acetyltransferase [Pseudomonadota bacterium]MBU4296411.1 GNAT family N-acetyltransferase [Pseudomonadota bacterium]MCG2748681.1 GNAT family N-acetyltransferase [Desulfobulbaceae bacterium]
MKQPAKVEFDQHWQEKYEDMISSPRKALSHVKNGHRVFIGTGCGEPQLLVEALTKRAGELADVEIVHLLTKGDAPYASPKLADSFSVNSFFIGQNVRGLIQEGLGSYTPMLLSDIPLLFKAGQLPLDVVLIQVTEPDILGKVSLGISVDIVKSAAENGSLVIAQVNKQMPWTFGDSLFDINDLDILVPADIPLIERVSKPMHEVSKKIAKHVASLVEDGSTVQFGLGRVPGIGRIPAACMHYLTDKKDIGIHTEMITDATIELIESGAVTGARKTMDQGKIVTSFCMGTKKLYDLINQNPLFSFKPTEYVNDSYIISCQRKMVSINMALEIDLTGQVCADSEGEKFYSGIGGQVDFNRGAARSKNGKAIIVLPATDEKAGKSRIVCQLSRGAGVVTTRGEVHYVVTEFGIAYLHGKNIEERTLALISIAHPDFREQLLNDAIEARYIRQEFASFGDKMVVASDDMKTSLLLDDGTFITFRPIHPTDEQSIRDLLYALSQETLYYRFMSNSSRFGHTQIKNFVYIDHRKDVAIVATLPAAHGEEMIAVGRYYLDERTNRAEAAFIVRDEWQNRGIGSSLFRHLITIAKRSGISGFTAEVLGENKKMQSIFNKSGYKVQSHLEEGVFSFRIDF